MDTLKKMRDLDTLLPELAAMREATYDLLVPVKDVSVITREETKLTDDGVDVLHRLALSHPDGITFDLTRPALSQLCTRISEGGAQDLPARYLDKLLQKGLEGNERAAHLAQENVGFWLDIVRDEKHRGGMDKQWFVRFHSDSPIQLDEDDLPTNGDLEARAILTDKYFAIDNLDLVATVVEVIRDFATGGHAAGVQCIDWRRTSTKLDLLFVNPRMAFDLKNPEAGVQIGRYKTQQDASGHFVKLLGDKGGDQHLVFPCARVTNSETGHGGLQVNAGAFEAVCFNKAMIGTNVVKRHLGALMDGTSRSVKTRDARRHAILCEIQDAVRTVFDPTTFETICKEFLGLFEHEISEVKPVIENVVRSTKLPVTLIDEILQAYSPITAGKDTLGDIQRAVTNLAVKEDCKPDLARDLEDAGGKMLTMTDKQLTRLLVV